MAVHLHQDMNPFLTWMIVQCFNNIIFNEIVMFVIKNQR